LMLTQIIFRKYGLNRRDFKANAVTALEN